VRQAGDTAVDGAQVIVSILSAADHRTVAILLPELVERQCYQYFLYNQRARFFAAHLPAQGMLRIVIIDVPGGCANDDGS